jgi:hypothetical protein
MAPIAFQHRISSGLFGLPSNAKSVDWGIINDSAVKQSCRVTVFKCPINAPKSALAPGPLTLNLDPGVTSHNANSVGTIFQIGFFYEVVVDLNDFDVLPSVQVWSDNGGTVIAGTQIPARSFVRLS